MPKIKFDKQNSFLLLATLVIGGSYFVINQPHGHFHVLRTSLDGHIPFWPPFIVPYVLFLLVFWLMIAYAYLKNVSFKALALSVIIVYLVSYVIYVIFPTYIPRPFVNGHDVFSDLVKFVYQKDKPSSGFPSTHASSATIMAMYFVMIHSRLRWLFVAFGLLVVLSTLLVKQHFVPDAVSGVGLGALVSYFVFSQAARIKGATEKKVLGE